MERLSDSLILNWLLSKKEEIKKKMNGGMSKINWNHNRLSTDSGVLKNRLI